MKVASLIRCAVVALATLFSTTAFAQQAEQQPEVEKHTGFFLQGSTGGGYITTNFDRGPSLKVYGLAALFDLGVGYSVAPGLALHGSLFGGIVMSPSLEYDGEDIPTRDDASVNLVGMGVGITYYTPVNLYISGSAGLGLVSVETDDDSEALEPGISLKAKVGYEWLLGRQLGLGLAAQMVFFRNAEKDIDGHWNSIGGGPVAILTFN